MPIALHWSRLCFGSRHGVSLTCSSPIESISQSATVSVSPSVCKSVDHQPSAPGVAF